MSYKALPPSLPPEVIKSIWAEILPSELDPKVVDAVHAGLVTPSKDWSAQFAQAAMEFPHFANTKEIARALGLNADAAYALVAKVKRQARENRK